MRKPFLLLLVAAVCGLIARGLPVGDLDERLEEEAARLQQRVDDASRELDDHAIRLATGASVDGYTDVHGWILEGSALRAWTGTSRFLSDSLLHGGAGHVSIGGTVLLRAVATRGRRTALVLREVWSSPPFTNSYLRPSFASWLDAPPGISASLDPGIGPVVRDTRGAVMFRLEPGDEDLPLARLDQLKLGLELAVIFLLVAAAWVFRRSIRDAWVASLVFMAVIVALRYASLLLYPIAPFDRLALFGPELYAASWWLPSLGDLLIDAALLLVMTRALHLSLRGTYLPPGLRGSAIGFALASLLLLLGRWITSAFIGLVEDSSVDLDLSHLKDLNAYSAIALLCMALLFGAWALACDTFARMLPTGDARRLALASLALAIVLSVVTHHLFGIVDLILVLWPVPLLMIALFARRHRYALWHAIASIGVVAFLGAHILMKYTERRSEHERTALAERLVTSEDPVVELLFRDAAPRLRGDAHVYDLLRDTGRCTAAELEALVRQEYFAGYWERFDVRLFAFGPEGDLRCRTTSEPPRSVTDATNGFSRTLAAVDMPELFIDAAPGERSFYHARVAVMASDTTPPAQLVVELHPRFSVEGSGFPELLLNDRDGLSRRLGRYAFARYEGGLLMEQRGGSFPVRWGRSIDPDRAPGGVIDGLDVIAYGDPSRSLVVLGVPRLRWVDHATLFSWLFAFLGLALAAALGVRGFLHWNGPPSIGIGWKVRIALLAFAALGLVLFTVGAQRLLTGLYGERNDAALMSSARSVTVELQGKLEGLQDPTSDGSAYLQHLLVKSSNVFFTDINLYGLDGALIATSRPQVFDTGLLGRRMHSAAFAACGTHARSEFLHDEHIGLARYRSAYLPLRDASGRSLAYVNLPSFSRQGELDRERGALFTAIVNLFVLLFALSLLAGIFISGWTTRPLGMLQRGLSRIALQGANQPIAYHGHDEVGELVKVYNRKVEELRASAEKLARSERESAWREMARQVAHEIKNPLTPMKLGIQHFQKTWDPGGPDAKAKLDRFTHSMVEQIDALSRVAGDFSRFAQMSAANEMELDLNEVVQSAVALFTGEPNAHIVLTTSATLRVKADREHLLRVFNNLIKNAVQAIPEGRHGRVDVRLRREGDLAIAEVQDNGSGIPEHLRERIFEPSFTTKGSGMGLGLAMVKRLVEQAGGSVSFASLENEGTTFTVSLPLRN